MTGIETIAQTLLQAMADNKSVHLLGEALPLSGAATPILNAHPDQCHLLPAADATLVGVAIGLALSGAKAVVELSGPEAVWGTLQQLGQESAALKGEFEATLVVRVPLRPDSPNLLPLLDGLDHIRVASPSNAADAGSLLNAALTTPGITILLEPITVLAETGGTAGESKLSAANVTTSGSHVTIAAWGEDVEAARAAARALGAEGIEAEIIDLRTLIPLDTDTLSQSVHKTGRLILVNGSAHMLQTATEHAFLRLESPPTIASTDQIISQARAAVYY